MALQSAREFRTLLKKDWSPVAEEALAISAYCALATDDFREAVLLAVNHSGDSDTTGSIAGPIIGLITGVDGTPTEWLDDLRLRAIVERIATDLHDVYHEDQTFSTEEYPPW